MKNLAKLSFLVAYFFNFVLIQPRRLHEVHDFGDFDGLVVKKVRIEIGGCIQRESFAVRPVQVSCRGGARG